jgi:hypothetical protein
VIEEKIKRIIRKIEQVGSGEVVMREPCDCGLQVRHNDGGRYHKVYTYYYEGGRWYGVYDTTCKLTPSPPPHPLPRRGVLKSILEDIEDGMYLTWWEVGEEEIPPVD